MILKFNTHGNEKQKDCARAWIDNTITEVVYGGSKGSAKSYTGCSLIFGDALTYPETHYFIARKELNDLRKFTIPSITEVLRDLGVEPEKYTAYNGTDNYYTLYNGSRVYLIAAKYIPSDPTYERFGSMQFTRGWIEEAGEFESSCKENLQASVGRWKNDQYGLVPKLLQTCNPSKNYLYKIQKLHKEGRLDDHIKFIQALPQDNKMLPEGYIENLERTLTGSRRERLLFGNWDYDNDPAILMEYDQITDIFTNGYVPPGRKYMTIDVARFGKDKSVIFVWSGWTVVEKVEIPHGSLTDLAKRVRDLAVKHKIPASLVVADEDGLGGGVVDMLKCKGFKGSSRPIQVKNHENYENLRSQCYFYLAEKVKNAGVAVKVEDDEFQELLSEELGVIKQKNIESDTKRGIVSKDEIKRLIGRSPDYSDTLMMRSLFDLRPTRRFSARMT